VWGDLRAAWRAARKAPLVFGLALASLALSVGLATATFTLFDSLLPRLGGAHDPKTLLMSEQVLPSEFTGLERSDTRIVEWAGDVREALGAHAPGSDRPLGVDSVSPNYFRVLGLTPAAGRFLEEQDAHHPQALVISYAVWQSAFLGNPDALGQRFEYSSQPREEGTIVGVAPAGFDGRFAPEHAYPATGVWRILATGAAPRATSGDQKSVRLFGRLAEGATLAQARSALAVALSRPETQRDGRPGAWVVTMRRTILRRWALGMSVPLFLPIVVLVVAANNIGLLLWTQAEARRHDIGLRLALGCGRWRLLRFVLVLPLTLTLGGWALGLPVARLFLSILPLPLTIYTASGIDRRAVLAALSLAGFAGLVAVAIAIRHSTRHEVSQLLRDHGPASRLGRRFLSPLDRLLALQITCAFTLAAPVVLYVRAARANFGERFAVDDRRVLSVLFAGSAPSGLAPGQGPMAEMQAWESVLATLPEVVSTAWASDLPGTGRPQTISIVAAPGGGSPATLSGWLSGVDGAYLRMLGIRLLAGRSFDGADLQDSEGAVIVNEALAQELGGTAALGRILRLGSDDQAPRTVVGIVDDHARARDDGLSKRIYIPVTALAAQPRVLLVSTRQDAGRLASRVKAALEAAHSNWRPGPVISLHEALRMRWPIGHLSRFLSVASVLTILLLGVGVYSATTYVATLRRREIAVRLAVGAWPAGIVRSILARSLRAMALGLLLGTPLSLSAVAVVRSFGLDMPIPDATALVLAAGCVTAVVLAATYVPARWAASVDPASLLRAE